MYAQSTLALSKTPIRRKIDAPDARGRMRLYADAHETPFCDLADTDLLDTADIGLLYDVAPRTVYRWIREHALSSHIKVGRELLFRKCDLLFWDEHYRPVMGRPPGS